jgi:chromosome segregation protein
MRAQLDIALRDKLDAENRLAEARRALAELDAELQKAGGERAEVEQAITEQRRQLEQVRLDQRALEVRLQELVSRFEQTGENLEETLGLLSEGESEESIQEELEKLSSRIARLGPINLAAIDEFNQLSERKTYLDSQHADLTEALTTLEEAIRKIDRETRSRFRETFDKVNNGMQALFPVLFGGGHAYLELTGEDLLETGVTVMARPPGKRNSTIHLLSGGEKALTAISFIFSIFELNPAPFCLLDEVDAPLDDNNVIRLCEMLRSMSRSVQFMFITHNKITMEIAEQLIGVTMQEAGVSRLVAVNMEEAVQLAATA